MDLSYEGKVEALRDAEVAHNAQVSHGCTDHGQACRHPRRSMGAVGCTVVAAAWPPDPTTMRPLLMTLILDDQLSSLMRDDAATRVVHHS